MALAPKTVLTYPLDGANRDFQIPFEYLARKFVQVTLIGKDRTLLTLNIDYRFTQRTIITTTKPWGPADGYERIEIRRYTSATERLVDFSDGSILRAYDLNTSQVQSLHIAEEGRDVASDTIGVNNDGDLDARGRKIVNLADAVADGDAVTLRQEKAWGEGALNQANRSKTEADRSAERAASSQASATRSEQQANGANQHRVAAGQSEANAKTSETNAASSENQARQYRLLAQDWASKMNGFVQGNAYSSQWYAAESAKSATASAERAASSSASADRSTREADRAKSEADKLGNANGLMAAVEAVSGDQVTWKGQHIWRSNNLHLFAPSGTAAFLLRDQNGGSWLKLEYRGANGQFHFSDSNGSTRLRLDSNGFLAGSGGADFAGNLLVRGSNITAQETQVGGGAYMNFHSPSGTEAALVYAYSGPNASLQFRVAKSARVWKLDSDGNWSCPNTGTTHLHNGNISSPIWKTGGNLYDTVRAVARPRQYGSRVLLCEGPVGSYVYNLSDDIWNYDAILYEYGPGRNVSAMGDIAALATLPPNTRFYTNSGPYWMEAQWLDTGATRRILQFTGFASGANSPGKIWGVNRIAVA